MKKRSAKKPFHERVAERLIDKLQSGTHSWERPWASSTMRPMNPVSGSVYKGINRLLLSLEDDGDPRWVTYKQAQDNGWQVRKGAKSETVQYWLWDDKRTEEDDRDSEVVQTNRRKRPRCFYANVFRAADVEGIPPYEPPPITWVPHDRAERILVACGATIRERHIDRAFYRPSTDDIHLPSRSQFPDKGDFYSVALHELAHWTGHHSRMNRDLTGEFGSEDYAKEELRADIASSLLCQELGIPYNNENHASYIQNWIEVLDSDHFEIFRAASEAEKMCQYILDHEKELEQSALTNVELSYFDLSPTYETDVTRTM